MKEAAEAEVTILLALHNGARHLQAQLQSFAAQTHTRWRLIVSDDGSVDAGGAIVQRFGHENRAQVVELIEGPQRGSAQNFLHLLATSGSKTRYAALSDHDDVWLPAKLSRAVAALAALPADRPALYSARTVICREDLTRLRSSPLWHRPFRFANALVQNVAAGNTIVLNRAALDLVQSAAPAAAQAGVAAHDWWLYQLISGAGGAVLRDAEPVLLYRQHARNQMGRNDTVGAVVSRMRKLVVGEFRRWNAANIAALSAVPELLTAENRTRLAAFAAARNSPLRARIVALRRAGIYRQTRTGNIVLWVAAALNRL